MLIICPSEKDVYLKADPLPVRVQNMNSDRVYMSSEFFLMSINNPVEKHKWNCHSYTKITILIGKIKLLKAKAISRWLISFWSQRDWNNRSYIWCILRSSVTICAPLTVTDGCWFFFLNCTKASWSICKTLNDIKVLPIKNMLKHLIQYLIPCFTSSILNFKSWFLLHYLSS